MMNVKDGAKMTHFIKSANYDITFCLSHCQNQKCSRNMDSKLYQSALIEKHQVICAELVEGCNDFLSK